MIVDEGLDALRRVSPGAVMSVGNFDGLHLGHQRILAEARAVKPAGAELVVVTFEPHPLTVLKPELAPPRLASSAFKRTLLESMGVDRVIILPPIQAVLNMTAEAFFEVLRDARVAHLVEGTDFNFGKNRGGNIERLRAWCERDGIRLTTLDDVTVTLCDHSVVPVSSSLVRWLVAHGRVVDAMRCLGRPYAVEGQVVRGEQRGRTIGFPTANLQIDETPLLQGGVYAARCVLDSKTHAVALSVGTKPTFNGRLATVEGYFLDFTGDLYGRHVTIDVVDWIRDQEKFPSLETLVSQLHRDVDRVRRLALSA
jgi:riboflavin kinase / FMN adenylyltransferase